MWKGKYKRLSDRELAYVEQALGAGVPFDLLWDVALDLIMTRPPWAVRDRAMDEARRLRRIIEEARQANVQGAGVGPSDQDKVWAARYATPEQIAYAKGEREDPGQAGEGGRLSRGGTADEC